MPDPQHQPAHPIDLIAIDLDGTLMGTDEQISQQNIDAIRRARAADITVLICTGRGLCECKPAMKAIDQRDPVMVAGGSIIADPVTGETLHRFTMDSEIVAAAIDMFHDAKCPVLVMKDPSQIGYDYLILNSDDEHPIHPITQWWIDDHQLRVKYANRLEHDEHPEHTVRVGIVAESTISSRVATEISAKLGDQAWFYDFPCVMPKDHVGDTIHILEMFAHKLNKWTAISWYLDKHSIDPNRVMAIGDQVNDIAMIEAAGIGIAMGNAIDALTERARYITQTNDEHGVAHAINAILDGQLDALKV